MRPLGFNPNHATPYGDAMLNDYEPLQTVTGRISAKWPATPGEIVHTDMHSNGDPVHTPRSYFLLTVDLSAIEKRVIAALTDNHWPQCPGCKQSATSKHGGKHTCTRCGWPNPRLQKLTAF